MGGRELSVPICAEDEQAGGGGVRHEVSQELQARLVNPVQVLEHEEHRTRCAGRFEQPHDGAVEEVALGVGVGALRGRHLAEALLKGGDHAGQLAAVIIDVRLKLRFGCIGDIVREGLVKRPVGRTHLLVAAPEQNGHPVLVGSARQLGEEGGLSLPGFAGNEDDLAALAGGHAFRGGAQDRQLVVPADHPDARAVGETLRQRNGSQRRGVLGDRRPTDLQGLDRVGEALQLQFARAR